MLISKFQNKPIYLKLRNVMHMVASSGKTSTDDGECGTPMVLQSERGPIPVDSLIGEIAEVDETGIIVNAITNIQVNGGQLAVVWQVFLKHDEYTSVVFIPDHAEIPKPQPSLVVS